MPGLGRSGYKYNGVTCCRPYYRDKTQFPSVAYPQTGDPAIDSLVYSLFVRGSFLFLLCITHWLLQLIHILRTRKKLILAAATSVAGGRLLLFDHQACGAAIHWQAGSWCALSATRRRPCITVTLMPTSIAVILHSCVCRILDCEPHHLVGQPQCAAQKAGKPCMHDCL